MSAVSFPSKTFLLGEYAILGGAPALLLAHVPVFETAYLPEPPEKPSFPPGSPAHRLAVKLGLNPARFIVRDPHLQRGGFGASGAEFLAVAKMHPEAPEKGVDFAWFARDLYKAMGESGSGADLLVQALRRAGIVFLQIKERRLERISTRLQARITLFHTGRKLPTHEHLQGLPPSAMLEYVPAIELGVKALRENDLEGLAGAVRSYAQGLALSGFVAPHTVSALEALAGMEGILAAKGCGAMGSDVILVLSQSTPSPWLAKWAKTQSLVEVASIEI